MTIIENMMQQGHSKSVGTFQLNCLKDENKDTLTKNLQSYLEQKRMTVASSTLSIKSVGKMLITKDFKPWWDEFSKRSPVSSSLHPNTLTASSSDTDRYDSWFSPKESSSAGASWLSGGTGELGKSSASSKSKVEDIPIPSIYETKLTSKGRRQLKRERKAEKEKTTGSKWFNMRAPDADDPARVDMELIRMRGVLDPKRFFKKHDRKAAPKYFQMGTVVDEGTEFYGSRLTKKQRKNTLVEELMADANVRQYNKKKYAELQQKMRGKKKQKSKKA